MTRELLNTLYVGTQDATIRLEDGCAKVTAEDETLIRVPIHHLGAVCAFGVVHMTTPFIAKCAEDGRTVAIFDLNGRFKWRATGKTGGNVLLRRSQWACHFDAPTTLKLAKCIVAGKLQNSRQVLMRAMRDYPDDAAELSAAALAHANALEQLVEAEDIDEVRGIEGFSASRYFGVFDCMVRTAKADFAFAVRSRRPPRDRMNALLSFVYSLATNDCAAALEGVGLDPQCGFLHVLRPGRPALALDLVEEFRSVIFDRLCLTLVNRKEIQRADLVEREGGSWSLTDDARKKVLIAYQNRKKEEVRHSLLPSKVPIGLLPHLQARLLARFLRGELGHYPPYRPC